MSENVVEIVVQMQNEIDKGAASVKSGLQSIKDKADNVVKSIFSLQNGLMLLAGAFAAKKIIGVTSAFEGYESALTTITGSAKKAEESMAWIEKFTTKTPYELDQVAQGFTSLSAYGLDATKDLKTLGDTASAMNKPLSQAVEAMADAVTGEFERLKEFGVRAKTAGDEVTFSWLQNGVQMQKTMAKTGAAIETGLLGILEGRFAGSMEKFSLTWAGMMSNLKDAWTSFLKTIGEAGLFDYAKDQLAALLSKIKELKDNGTLAEWAKRLSAAFQESIAVVKKYIDVFVNLASNFDGIAAKIVELIPTIIDIGVKVGIAVSAFSALIPVVIALGSAFAGWVIGKFAVDFAGLAIASGLLGTKLTALLTIVKGFGAAIIALKGVFAAAAIGVAIGTWINSFEGVKKAAQGTFATIALLISVGKEEVLGYQLAWAKFRKQQENVDAIKKQIAAEKEYQKQKQDLLKDIEKEGTARQKTAQIAVAAEKEKEKAIRTRAEIEKEVMAMAKKDLEEKLKIYQDETKSREAELAKQVAAIHEAETAGIISHAEAITAKNNAELQFSKERMEQAKYISLETAKLYGDESKEYQKAKDLAAVAEKKYAGVRIGIAKQTSKDLIAEAKAMAKEIEEIEKALSEKINAEHERRFTEIEIQESKGVISHAEAVKQKLELEKKWLKQKVAATTAAIDSVIAEYGRDSAEYIKALSEKINAETDLMIVDEELRAVLETPKVVNIDIEPAEEKVKNLTQQLDGVILSVKDPIPIDFNIKPAQAAIKQLAKEWGEMATASAYALEKLKNESSPGASATRAFTSQYEYLTKSLDNATKQYDSYRARIEEPIKSITDFRATASPEDSLTNTIRKVDDEISKFKENAEEGAKVVVDFDYAKSLTKITAPVLDKAQFNLDEAFIYLNHKVKQNLEHLQSGFMGADTSIEGMINATGYAAKIIEEAKAAGKDFNGELLEMQNNIAETHKRINATTTERATEEISTLSSSVDAIFTTLASAPPFQVDTSPALIALDEVQKKMVNIQRDSLLDWEPAKQIAFGQPRPEAPKGFAKEAGKSFMDQDLMKMKQAGVIMFDFGTGPFPMFGDYDKAKEMQDAYKRDKGVY